MLFTVLYSITSWTRFHTQAMKHIHIHLCHRHHYCATICKHEVWQSLIICFFTWPFFIFKYRKKTFFVFHCNVSLNYSFTYVNVYILHAVIIYKINPTHCKETCIGISVHIHPSRLHVYQVSIIYFIHSLTCLSSFLFHCPCSQLYVFLYVITESNVKSRVVIL